MSEPKEPTQFEVGELVQYEPGAAWRCLPIWGRVTRVTPSGTVFVRSLESGIGELQFRRGRGVERPSEHALAMFRWNQAKPQTRALVVTVGRSYFTSDDLTLYLPRQVAQSTRREILESIAADASEIATWLAREPDPRKVTCGSCGGSGGTAGCARACPTCRGTRKVLP